MYLIHSAYMLLLLLGHSCFCLTPSSPRCFAPAPMYNSQWQFKSTRSHRSQGAPPRDSRHTSRWFNHHRLSEGHFITACLLAAVAQLSLGSSY
jgi:hypothetical protein